MSPKLRLILIRTGIVVFLLWGAVMALSFFAAAAFHREHWM
jgi:hypothetical protein